MKITIVGAGISGLSLAFEIQQRKPSAEITILDSDSRPGGKIWTEKHDGYLCEAGVNGFLSNKPGTLRLANVLGLDPLRSNDSSRKRAIFTGGRLRMLPEKPLAFMTSNFLSLPGRIRMAMEFFVPKKKLDDETMESFAVRRVGREFFEKLLDPLASGVFAGDPSKMSIRSCFQKVYDLEQQYGGLLKGFAALGREARKSGKTVEAGPGGVLYSFLDGMYSLIGAIEGKIGNTLVLNREVHHLEPVQGGYKVHCRDGFEIESECVVLACPAHAAIQIIKTVDVFTSTLLEGIPYPPLSVVALGFEKDKIRTNTNFFGFLIPFRERRKILGTLFDSSIFVNRAPKDRILLRSMVGGARAPHLALLDNHKLVHTVLEELARTAGIREEPEFVRVFRWERAIPQYHVGHVQRLEKIDDALSKRRGVYLHGNAYRGVAVNDCVANSALLADRIISDFRA